MINFISLCWQTVS